MSLCLKYVAARFVMFAAIAVFAMAAGAQGAEPPNLIGASADASSWTTFAAEGVDIEMSVEPDPAGHGTAIRLRYDFRLGSGYAGIRRHVSARAPANYELSFDLKSDLPDNNLETKLVDPSGLNVWWVNRRAIELPREWTRISARKRQFEFAWGPSGGAMLDEIGTVEIVIASAEGGKGEVWVRNIELRELPAVSVTPAPMKVSASSNGAAAVRAIDGDVGTAWESASGDGAARLVLDLGGSREIGGLDVMWGWAAESAAGSRPHAPASVIEVSDDGVAWRTVRECDGSSGERQFFRLQDLETRYVALGLRAVAGARVAGVREIGVIPVEDGATGSAFATYIARRAPRGVFPRGFVGEQSYWTVIGMPGSTEEALVGEDGAVELGRKAFSVEPFLMVGDELRTWASASTTHTLEREVFPIPTVTSEWDGLRLATTAFVEGDAVWVRYVVTNAGKEPVRGRLCLALRPFQVNPPTQWLNLPGGAASVRSVEWKGNVAVVDGDRAVRFPDQPARTGASSADGGECVWLIASGAIPSGKLVRDPMGGGSAFAMYEADLAPGERKEWWLEGDLGKRSSATARILSGAGEGDGGGAALERVASVWAKLGGECVITLPAAQREIVDTARSTLAYILINKDGPGIQPGSRNYERSWIRDGSLTSAAMLSFGLGDEVREFIEWYAPRQFSSGAVPCVVDRRGPDPVPEHDSHGQLIWLIWNYQHYAGRSDPTFLHEYFTYVRAAAEHMQKLREERLTSEWMDSGRMMQEPGKAAVPARAFSGLMPASISHEGYSSKPMHSYWDDSFGVLGMRCAAELATEVGETQLAARYRGWAADFQTSLDRSVLAAAAVHGIEYMPGCVELGDFDATSTTVALWPCGVDSPALRPLIERTFERNWASFVERREQSPPKWKDYTPYELRQVGTYVQLGQPDRAAAVLDFHMKYRRPAGWNHWAEVVRPGLRTPGFVGDMPHTWCGSDFLNSLRIMLAYENTGEESIVVFGGIPEEWTRTGEEIGFAGLGMPGGNLNGRMVRSGDQLTVRLSGTCPPPRGGFRLRSPSLRPVSQATINGEPVAVSGAMEVRFDTLPVSIDLTLGPVNGD